MARAKVFIESHTGNSHAHLDIFDHLIMNLLPLVLLLLLLVPPFISSSANFELILRMLVFLCARWLLAIFMVGGMASRGAESRLAAEFVGDSCRLVSQIGFVISIVRRRRSL